MLYSVNETEFGTKFNIIYKCYSIKVLKCWNLEKTSSQNVVQGGPRITMSRGGTVVEYLPPTNVGERFFSRYSGFPLSSKTNISKFQFDLEPEGHRNSCKTAKCHTR